MSDQVSTSHSLSVTNTQIYEASYQEKEEPELVAGVYMGEAVSNTPINKENNEIPSPEASKEPEVIKPTPQNPKQKICSIL